METNKRILTTMQALLLSCSVAACQTHKGVKKSPADMWRESQDNLIQQHADILIKDGRMPAGAFWSFSILATYGWHSYSDPDISSAGPTPALAVLQYGRGGGFGAYSFSEAAFQQAKRCWWIDGVMETGSDLLHPMNSNAHFDKSVIGHHVSFIHQYIDEQSYPSLRNVEVIALPTYSDGSLKDYLQLAKKSRGFVQQWGIAILPADYVDMCACTFPATEHDR